MSECVDEIHTERMIKNKQVHMRFKWTLFLIVSLNILKGSNFLLTSECKRFRSVYFIVNCKRNVYEGP